MNTAEISALLDAADEHLLNAIDRLVTLGNGEGDYCSSIQQAAQALQKIQRGWDTSANRTMANGTLAPRLLGLVSRTATVEHLMDSAATLCLGQLAANAGADLGYCPDGAMERGHEQRSLVVNG